MNWGEWGSLFSGAVALFLCVRSVWKDAGAKGRQLEILTAIEALKKELRADFVQMPAYASLVETVNGHGRKIDEARDYAHEARHEFAALWAKAELRLDFLEKRAV